MPQMGVSVAEGTIVEWRKRVGDWVEADEPIVEISTDKVETEIPSPASGRVAQILVEPGTTVDVGAVLCRLDVEARPGVAHVDEGSEPEPERTAHSAQRTENGGNGHAPPISPVVRRMADEHGVDLSQVEGSGRRGRVTKQDLLAFLGDKPDTRHPTPGRNPPSTASRHTGKRSLPLPQPAASSSASCAARSASTWCVLSRRRRTAPRLSRRT